MAETKPNSGSFSDAEKAAMRERAKELRAEAKQQKSREQGEKDVLAAISELSTADQKLGRKLHEIVTEVAPSLMPKTWYGMPAYATADGKVVVFFKGSSKFDSKYSTLGFEEAAHLDNGNMWPTSYALLEMGSKEETEIRKLVKQAIS